MAILSKQIITAKFVFGGLMSFLLIDVALANSNQLDKTAEYRNLVSALREDFRETKISDKLRVNRENRFRLISPNKCEKEGEFELHQLALSASVEESYVLIPDLCLWIEVGFNEQRNRVQLDSKFINTILSQYSSLVFYHIHAGDFPDLENYFPAYKDLITLVLINAESVWKPHSQIKHRLITNLGMIEYEFSNIEKVKYFLKKYRGYGLRGNEAQNLAYEYLRAKYKDEYYAKVQKCKSNSGTVQQKIINCCPIITDAFTLNFHPTTADIKYKITAD